MGYARPQDILVHDRRNRMQGKSRAKSAKRPMQDAQHRPGADGSAKKRSRGKGRRSKEQLREELEQAARDSGVWTNGTAPAPGDAGQRKSHGRIAAAMQRQGLRWFLPGWIGRDMLSVVVGRKNVGKSSFLAWLMGQAKRPAILPGFEESVEVMMLPRWQAHGVPLADLLVLDDQHYSPVLQKTLLTGVLQEHRCDLLVIENLDSYLPDGHSENDSQCVRPYLEALHGIAAATGCAVVGTRHPGKIADNICRGSQAWETAPRITLVLEREDGPLPAHWLWCHRCGVGPIPEPLGYTLVREGEAPPVFTLASASDRQALAIAQQAPDQLDRARLQVAIDLLQALLQEDWVEARTVFAEGEKERLGESTLRRAARILGVKTRREGSGLNHKSFWGRSDLDLPWGEADLPKEE